MGPVEHSHWNWCALKMETFTAGSQDSPESVISKSCHKLHSSKAPLNVKHLAMKQPGKHSSQVGIFLSELLTFRKETRFFFLWKAINTTPLLFSIVLCGYIYLITSWILLITPDIFFYYMQLEQIIVSINRVLWYSKALWIINIFSFHELTYYSTA